MQKSKAKAVSILLAIVITVAAAQVFVLVYFVLGMFTGILGMCAIAPDWWQKIYFNLLYLIPLLSVVAGILFGRQIYEKQKFDFHI